jgi:TrkA domain protein
MSINERDLPGIGRQYELSLRGGRRLVIGVHRSGRRDLYVTERGTEDPAWIADLSEPA